MKKLTVLFSIITMSVSVLSFTSCGRGDANYKPADTTGGATAIENIMTRVSVRQYTGQPVSEDTLQIILKAAMAAPSAVNKQPWHFVVVNDKAKRDKLGEILQGVGDKTKTAGAVVLVCGDKTRFIEDAPEYWVQDCSAATENLLLAVNALKLGAVWCGVYPVQDRVKQVKEMLGLPENIIPLNVVTIGYPTAIENPKDKWDPAKITTI